MNITEALNWRYAVRQFSPERIEEAQIQELLNATRLSPTSYGLQPYRLVLVNDLEIRRQLLPYAMGQDKVVNCSHLVVIAVQTEVGNEMIERYLQSVAETRGTLIEELVGYGQHMKEVFAQKSAAQKREWAHQQAYIALGTLLTSAAVMKIDACPMTGFEAAGFDRILGLHDMGLESSSICALGVRHTEDSDATLPKVRYEQAEMVITI